MQSALRQAAKPLAVCTKRIFAGAKEKKEGRSNLEHKYPDAVRSADLEAGEMAV